MQFTYQGRPCIFLDVEASGLLPGSFPIEVGWTADDEAPPASVLIRPAPGWTYWDPRAQDLHGITRKQLAREGVGAAEACALLDATCAEATVLSDAPSFDDYWFTRLYDTAGVERSWLLTEIEALYAALAISAGLRRRDLLAVLTAAERAFPRPHRAGPDTLAMARTAGAIADPLRRRALLG